MTPGLTLRYAARSDIGLRRTGNEDSGFADTRLLMVADGMGGHAAGELASAMAVATFAELAAEDIPDDAVLEYLSGGIDQVSERIGDVITADPANQGMGTTVTGMAWLGERMALVHVGDSRAYRLRDGVLSQITKDHTYVQSLVDAGEITAEEATRHPRRNLLNRAVDGIHAVEADLSMRETRPGDRYLLCTDGLSGVVPDELLADVLIHETDLTGAVTTLVDLALEAGAPDNVTVVLADIVSADDNGTGVPRAGEAVVVGAAGEPANRAKLPPVQWPMDTQIDPEAPEPRTRPQPAEPAAAEEPEAAERVVTRRWTTRRMIVAAVSAVVVFLAMVGALLLWWLSSQWYVATADGHVAIYRGVPGTLGTIPLQRQQSVTDVAVASLPTYDQTRVSSGMLAGSQEQAAAIVSELRIHVAECRVNPATAGCPEPQR